MSLITFISQNIQTLEKIIEDNKNLPYKNYVILTREGWNSADGNPIDKTNCRTYPLIENTEGSLKFLSADISVSKNRHVAFIHLDPSYSEYSFVDKAGMTEWTRNAINIDDPSLWPTTNTPVDSPTKVDSKGTVFMGLPSDTGGSTTDDNPSISSLNWSVDKVIAGDDSYKTGKQQLSIPLNRTLASSSTSEAITIQITNEYQSGQFNGKLYITFKDKGTPVDESKLKTNGKWGLWSKDTNGEYTNCYYQGDSSTMEYISNNKIGIALNSFVLSTTKSLQFRCVLDEPNVINTGDIETLALDPVGPDVPIGPIDPVVPEEPTKFYTVYISDELTTSQITNLANNFDVGSPAYEDNSSLNIIDTNQDGTILVIPEN